MRPDKRRALDECSWGLLLEQAEKLNACVRAKVEHPSWVVKRQFGHIKVRYRGLAKNMASSAGMCLEIELNEAKKRAIGGKIGSGSII